MLKNRTQIRRTRIVKRVVTCGGAILIEFAIVFPVFFLTLLGLFDLAGWLNIHLYASRIVYEGARFAITVPQLEYGDFRGVINSEGDLLDSSVTVGGLTSSPASPNQSRILLRIGRVVIQSNASKTPLSQVLVSGSYHNDCTNDPGSDLNRTITIGAEIPYSGSIFIKNKPVKSTARATYLFANPVPCIGG